jgi:hypothetical protein
MKEHPSDPRASAYPEQWPIANRWRWVGAKGAKWRMPVQPGPSPELGKAQREQRARAEARVARLHLISLFSVGVTVIGLVLAAVVVMFVLVVIGHH